MIHFAYVLKGSSSLMGSPSIETAMLWIGGIALTYLATQLIYKLRRVKNA